MTTVKFSVSLCLIAIILVLWGCSSYPKEAVEKAKQSLQKAKTVEANVYAESLYTIAFNKFIEARPFLENRKWKKVKNVAEETVVLSEQAIAAVELGKARYKIQAGENISQMHDGFVKCSLMVDRKSKIKRKSDLEVGQQKKDSTFLARVQSFMEQAKTNYNAGNYRKSVEFSEEVNKGVRDFQNLCVKITQDRKKK